MRRSTALVMAIALLGCDGAADEAANAANRERPSPDLAACPKSEDVDEAYRERNVPIPVPEAFGQMAKSDMDHLAVTTMSGGTVCVDAGWMEAIQNAKTSEDGRFLQFDWGGYEAFGHIVVDRSGNGQVIETGTSPLAPPSGRRFASLDLSESAFGGFNAFGVWTIEPVGLRVLAKVQEGFPPGDWWLEGWSGDHCVDLSVVPVERQQAGDALEAPQQRDPWHVAEAQGWKPTPGQCPQP